MKEWLSTRGAKLGVAMTCGALLAMVLAAAAVPALAQSVTQVGTGNQACVQTATQAEVGKVQISQYGDNVNIQNIAQECNVNVAQVEEAVASASAAAAPAAVQYQYAAPEVQYSAPTARPNCDVPDPPPVCDGDEPPDEPPLPPSNDNWANAIDLGEITYLRQAVTGGNSNLATMEPGEPRPQDPTKDCGIYGVSNSVWYKVRPIYEKYPTAGGKIQLSTEGSDFDTAIALYEQGASLTSMRQVACSNDNSGPNWTDRLSANVDPGQTYYIQLLGTGGDRSGHFSLKASQCVPPGCLRIATFNVLQSHLNDNFGEATRKRVLENWGRDLLSRADVVFLEEVRNDEWVSRMSQSSGLPYWYSAGPICPTRLDLFTTDVAIVSRYPMSYTARHEIPPREMKPCPGLAPGFMLRTSEILEAGISIDGVTHRFFATHWDSGKTRWEVTEARTKAAEISVDQLTRMNPYRLPQFYGGDLNECRPSSATDPNNLCVVNGTPIDAPGTSVGLLLSSSGGNLSDPLTDLWSNYGRYTNRVSTDADGTLICDPAPIDDVFYHTPPIRGRPVYLPVEYTHDCTRNFPSDHPFVLMAFDRIL